MRNLASTAASLAILAGMGLAFATPPTPSQAYVSVGVGINVGFPPPALPVYYQPPIPGPGYVWTPGYWAWSAYYNDYYWVPGTWVVPPQVGFLWTPGYWGWNDGVYAFFPGYWGLTVGFYGGIDYGFGYPGFGYAGGYWRGRDFFYNRAVNNLGSARIATTFNQPVRASGVRTAFNGGPGGVRAAANAQQLAARQGTHLGATSAQLQQQRLASRTPALRAGVNHGAPAIAATARAGSFRGAGVTKASNAGTFTRPAGATRGVTTAARTTGRQGPTTGATTRVASSRVGATASATRGATTRTASTRHAAASGAVTHSRASTAAFARASHGPSGSAMRGPESRQAPRMSAQRMGGPMGGPRSMGAPRMSAPMAGPRMAAAPRGGGGGAPRGGAAPRGGGGDKHG